MVMRRRLRLPLPVLPTIKIAAIQIPKAPNPTGTGDCAGRVRLSNGQTAGGEPATLVEIDGAVRVQQ